MTMQSISEVERLVHENCHVPINEMAESINVNCGTVHYMIHNILRYHQVSNRWVPRQLKPDIKECRVGVCKMLLRHYEAEREDFLQCIATGDEF